MATQEFTSGGSAWAALHVVSAVADCTVPPKNWPFPLRTDLRVSRSSASVQGARSISKAQTEKHTLKKSSGGHTRKDSRKLSRLTGTRFDEAFLSFVIDETLDAIDDAQEAARESKSPAVRAHARQLLECATVAALEAGESVLGGDFDGVDDD
jgi:hypothetical protein